MRRRFHIEVRDGLVPIGVIDNYNTFEAILRFCEVSRWTLTIAADQPNAALLTQGRGAYIWLDGELLLSGPIVTLKHEWSDQETGAGLVTAAGRSDEELLWRAITYPNPALEAEAQDKARYEGSGFIGEVAAELVRANIGDQARPERRVGVQVPPAAVVGQHRPYSTRFDVLGELLNQWATEDGTWGFRVLQRSGSLPVFETFAPRDVSRSVYFSPAAGNLADFSYEVAAPEAARLIVACQGEGVDRYIKPFDFSDQIGGWRLGGEKFVDRRDIGIAKGRGFPAYGQDASLLVRADDNTGEELTDTSGNGNHLSFVGSWRNGAPYFTGKDGDDGPATHAFTETAPVYTDQSFTISTWSNWDHADDPALGGSRTIWSLGDANTSCITLKVGGDGELIILSTEGGGFHSEPVGVLAAAHTWQNVIVSCDAGTRQVVVWVDGQRRLSYTLNEALWRADRFQLARLRWYGEFRDGFAGHIASIGALRQVITDEQAAQARIVMPQDDGGESIPTNERLALVDKAAAEAWQESKPQTNLAITPIDTDAIRFGRDYRLGDVVSVVTSDNIVIKDRVQEIRLSDSITDGPRVSPTVGTSAATQVPGMFTRLSRALKKLTSLETRY